MPMRNAFTLIELLIVVAIIGILAAIAVPNFLHAQIRAKIAGVQADFNTLVTAAEMYRIDWNRFPLDGAYVDNQTEQPNAGYRGMLAPVAYINSIEAVRDRFALPQYRSRPGSDYDQFYEFGFSDARTGAIGAEFVRDRFIIESVGPDGMDSIQSTRVYPAQMSLFIAYHPSNGVSSTGDIYRAGGASVPGWLPASTAP